MAINSNHSFRAFGVEIRNSRNWLQSRIVGVCGYSSAILLDRLAQRLVELSLRPFAEAVLAASSGGTANSFPAPGSQIRCGRASMQLGTGAIHVSLAQLVANHKDFLIHWAYCLWAILFPSMTRTDGRPAILVFGVSAESLFADGSDDRFVSYCRHGPIRPLAEGKRFLVQSAFTTGITSHRGFTYCLRPLIQLLRSTGLGLGGRLSLAAKHFLLLAKYVVASIRWPAITLIAKDFAYSAISLELDRCGQLESIVFTTSNYGSQPLWVRGLTRAKTHLVWYAQNFKPVTYRADGVDSEIPYARWIRVDTHWVWTRAFANYLETLGHRGTLEIVGPIVWYLPQSRPRPTNSIDLVVFDISPSRDEVALNVGGYISNYNNVENLHSFVADVLTLKASLVAEFQLPVVIRLKTKRGYDPIYDKGYFDYLDQLNSLGEISLIQHSANIYSLISSSHLAIVYPFSSPAYIAEAINVPSIYYDPTQSIVEQNFADAPELVQFASGPDELFDAAVKSIRKVMDGSLGNA